MFVKVCKCLCLSHFGLGLSPGLSSNLLDEDAGLPAQAAKHEVKSNSK